MLQRLFIENPIFWKILEYLENLRDPISMNDACSGLGITEDQMLKGVFFLQKLHYQIELVKEKKNKFFLVPPKNKTKIQVELSLLEWISLQAYFPLMEQMNSRPFHETLVKKFIELEKLYKNKDLFEAEMSLGCHGDGLVEFMQNKNCKDGENILPAVEFAILNRTTLSIQLQENKSIKVYPHRIVHLEGRLMLIGEDTHNRCIISLEVAKMNQIGNEESLRYQANFSKTEISDFIDAIRAVSGNGMRLILKIYSFDKMNFSPTYHYLGNPYITTNGEGDIIWAATVEPCEEIFKWVKDLGSEVEILDPESFKNDFAQYCQNKLNKAG